MAEEKSKQDGIRPWVRFFSQAAACSLVLGSHLMIAPLWAAQAKMDSLSEWRRLTVPLDHTPEVHVRRDNVRIYFQTNRSIVEFSAKIDQPRIPTPGYGINSALLKLEKSPTRAPALRRGWREATVIAGAEAQRLLSSLIAALTPQANNHGIYYQGLMTDRLLYRDAQGWQRSATMDSEPTGVVIDARLSIDETLQTLARLMEEQLAQTHPSDNLFFLVAPHTHRFLQPLLLDVQNRKCIWLSPEGLTDPERGVSLVTSRQGLWALLVESHGLALVKNPVSSLARLADLGLQTAVRFLRLPLPRGRPVPLAGRQGMNLAAWEQWLDGYTGTRRQPGALDLLINGERFFPRLQQAIVEATNHVSFETFIFDKDDVAISMADDLKTRASQLETKVLLDRMGSLAAGLAPPATPLPDGFVPPASISRFLKTDSDIQVHHFLNPWFTSDHSKMYLVDGTHAWLGGMNIGREYRYEWHDLMVEVTGPVVASLERDFQRHWAHEGPYGDLGYLATALAQSQDHAPFTAMGTNWIPVRLLPTRTLWKPFNSAVQGALRRAERYIYLENPYLIHRRAIRGLVQARQRGVDVRVILPRVNDFKAGGRSNLVIANLLLMHGVRVYFYPGMTHVKALLVDDWSCVGSGNLNHLSLRLCQEENIASSDPGFASRLKRELFESDFARSYELNQPLAVNWLDFLADFAVEGF